jgi:hypothetical protein
MDRRLDDLRKIVASEQNRLVPETPPLYRMTPRQRQAVHKGIDFISEIVAQNIIRPDDEQQVRELRRREAAAHSRSSAVGVQIYKSGAPNLYYASQRPTGWNEAAATGSRFVGTAEAAKPVSGSGVSWASGNNHCHSSEDTLLIDVRLVCVPPDQQDSTVTPPVPVEFARSVHFPYAMMSPDERRSLQSRSQHTAFVKYVTALSHESMRGAPLASSTNALRSMRDIVTQTTAQTGLSLNCVQFRYDSYTLELVLEINSETSHFGILAFNVPPLASASSGADGLESMRAVRSKVMSELSAAHNTDVASATVAQPTLGRIHNEADKRAALAQLDGMQQLANDYCRSHEVLAAQRSYGTRVDRLIARGCPLRVMMPLKSPTLCGLQARFAYAYFTTCQCLCDNDDLSKYKKRYATVARRQRQPGTRRVALDELVPLYDSDVEQPRARVDPKRKHPPGGGDGDDDVDDKYASKRRAPPSSLAEEYARVQALKQRPADTQNTHKTTQ